SSRRSRSWAFLSSWRWSCTVSGRGEGRDELGMDLPGDRGALSDCLGVYMEAFLLTAALLTVDSAVRESPEYALAGQLAVSPSESTLSRDLEFAREHLRWLEA